MSSLEDTFGHRLQMFSDSVHVDVMLINVTEEDAGSGQLLWNDTYGIRVLEHCVCLCICGISHCQVKNLWRNVATEANLVQICLILSYLSIILWVYLSFYLTFYLTFYLLLHLSVYRSIHSSIGLSVCISAKVYIHLSIHLSLYHFFFLFYSSEKSVKKENMQQIQTVLQEKNIFGNL